jgi:hypothetical protein
MMPFYSSHRFRMTAIRPQAGAAPVGAHDLGAPRRRSCRRTARYDRSPSAVAGSAWKPRCGTGVPPYNQAAPGPEGPVATWRSRPTQPRRVPTDGLRHEAGAGQALGQVDVLSAPAKTEKAAEIGLDGAAVARRGRRRAPGNGFNLSRSFRCRSEPLHSRRAKTPCRPRPFVP